jgi:hypothetical protein
VGVILDFNQAKSAHLTTKTAEKRAKRTAKLEANLLV